MEAQKEVVAKDLADKGFTVSTMNFYGSTFSVTPESFTINNYYGDKFLDDMQRKETVEELCKLCVPGKKLYLYIKDLHMTKWCIEYVKMVDDPIQLGQIVAVLVKQGVMTEDQVVSKEFIECLRNSCECSDKIGKGMTIDNIRKHIHNCLLDR